MSNLKQLRQEAGLTGFKLAALADVSMPTISRMERGDKVSIITANKVLRTLSEQLGRKITLEEAGVHIIEEKPQKESVA